MAKGLQEWQGAPLDKPNRVGDASESLASATSTPENSTAKALGLRASGLAFRV